MEINARFDTVVSTGGIYVASHTSIYIVVHRVKIQYLKKLLLSIISGYIYDISSTSRDVAVEICGGAIV